MLSDYSIWDLKPHYLVLRPWQGYFDVLKDDKGDCLGLIWRHSYMVGGARALISTPLHGARLRFRTHARA